MSVLQRQEDGELVAAGTGKHVMGTERALEPSRDRDQQFVPRERPQTGVDPAEAIEVHHQDRVPRALFGLGEQSFQPVAELGTIGKPRKAVRHQLAAQVRFGLQFRRMVDQADEAAIGGGIVA